MKKSRILFVSIIACMLLLPLASITTTSLSEDLSVPIENQSAPAMVGDVNRIGAIEGIVTQIDPEGGVRNAIGTFQNASYYGITYAADYQAVVEGQMATDTGYVSFAQLEIAGRATYPNGHVGDGVALLTITVNPIIVIPSNPATMYATSPTLAEAQAIADELVAEYEEDLLIEFDRLATMKNPVWLYENYEGLYYVDEMSYNYQLQYVSIPSATSIDAAMSATGARLSGLGGFMDILDGDDWPLDRTSFAETLLFSHFSEESMFSLPSGMLNPLYMYMTISQPYVRADSSHTEYVETVHTGVIAMAGFDAPDYIVDAAGPETYSIKQHVGFTGDIESKMFQDTTINSISSVVAVVPTELEISGISESWGYVGKDFTFNSTDPLYLPTGQHLPGDATADEIIQTVMNSYPYQLGVMLNQSISYLDPTMFDYFIDSLWTSAGPFPDMRQYIRDMDFSMMFTGFPLVEVNQDALRMIMENAGITPDALLDEVDETLIISDPMRALVEAFISCIDSYNLLDILQSGIYSNPYALEDFLNDYIADIDSFISDFTGMDIPSSYATKEAFAALIEDHFGIILQGLWDAMADFTGDTSEIKAAVHAMIDPAHLSEEIVPYFIADLYASAISEYDYAMYVNFALPDMGSVEPYDPLLLWLSVEDIVITCDLDLSGIDFEGPHCIIRKSVPELMTPGTGATVTISVANIGDAPAYDLKILDGISAGFDADKQYYWNRAELVAGGNWTVTCTYTPEEIGSFVVIPTILCYFNATLDSFDPGNMENWHGAAFYTTSALVADRDIAVGNWWEGEILGVPTIIIVAGGGGVALLVIIVIVKKRA